MKLLSVATLLLAAPLVSAASLSSFFDPSQATIRGDPVKEPPVNGKNPLEFCDDPENHILQIDHVDLDPNPPKAYVGPSSNLLIDIKTPDTDLHSFSLVDKP